MFVIVCLLSNLTIFKNSMIVAIQVICGVLIYGVGLMIFKDEFTISFLKKQVLTRFTKKEKKWEN